MAQPMFISAFTKSEDNDVGLSGLYGEERMDVGMRITGALPESPDVPD